jgi:transcriptional regulator with XRE-family HTH domain
MKDLREYFHQTMRSQAQLADTLNVSRGFICEITSGKKRPSPELAAKIEKITGIPLRRLLLPDEVEPAPKPDDAAETPEEAKEGKE